MDLDQQQYQFFGYKTGTWIYLFLGALAVATVIIYLNFPSAYNQGIYHYQGLVIKNGGLPYTGFIEKKGPMGLLTYSLASLLFGESAMAYRLFDLIILGITGTYLFRLAKLFYSRLTAVLISVIWLSHVIIEGPGNTADVTNIITACYVILAFHLLAPKKKNYYWVAGLLIGMACWVKPTALIIAMPLLFLFFTQRFEGSEKLNLSRLLQIGIGLLIPTVVFTLYLFISGTFHGFWEAVVLDPLLNYADDVSRFSLRTVIKTGKTFLQDPVFRIGGVLALFLLPSNQVIRLARILVIGIAIMLFIEGRFYPYHYSILWTFLILAAVHGFIVLTQKLKLFKQRAATVILVLIILIPTVTIGTKFIKTGGLTNEYYAGEMFLFPDFKEMYDFRRPVVSYLNGKLNSEDQIMVLGRDPNIYLELGVITTCRSAREGHSLIGDNSRKTPDYLIVWQKELVQYMLDEKAEWIIVLKELAGNWLDAYSADMNLILTEKYQLMQETTGHFIYQRTKANAGY
ncbi:MAG: hypothetical protein ACI8ZM_005426 [Crocinitomix sp.]|jgi:hypothetical protein